MKRIYTEATSLLKELHKNYKGNKTGSSNLRDARYFDNTDEDYQTGCFNCNSSNTICYHIECSFDKVSEQEFINHMQFSEELLTKCKNNLLGANPSTLKVEAGKRYVRRDGITTGNLVNLPLEDGRRINGYNIIDPIHNHTYRPDGSFHHISHSRFDLISEYVEEKEETSDFKTITDSIASLMEYKNKNYGNSALEPLEIFGGKCKVGTRLDDKLARIKNSDSLRKNDVADLIGYAILICKENNWTDFEDLKD